MSVTISNRPARSVALIQNYGGVHVNVQHCVDDYDALFHVGELSWTATKVHRDFSDGTYEVAPYRNWLAWVTASVE